LVGARVRLEWTSYTSLTGASAADALREHVNGFEATPDPRGFYRFCGVPAQTTLRVMALSGDAESEVHEVRVDLDDHAVVLDMVVGRNGRGPGGAPAR
jgi:hypothetical protein